MAWLRGFDTCSRRKGRDKKIATEDIFRRRRVMESYLESYGCFVMILESYAHFLESYGEFLESFIGSSILQELNHLLGYSYIDLKTSFIDRCIVYIPIFHLSAEA